MKCIVPEFKSKKIQPMNLLISRWKRKGVEHHMEEVLNKIQVAEKFRSQRVMEKTNWYAVFTASRAEKRVKERLEQAGIENYLPVRKVEFVRDGLVKRLEVPVITGCIFCPCF